MDKATLKVVIGGNVPMSLKFQYNPEKITLEKGASWTRHQAKENESTPPPQFGSSEPATVTMEIFFDKFSLPFGDVIEDVQTLLMWTKPCPGMTPSQPPLLAFEWGSNEMFSGFVGFLKRVNVTYTMFRVDGAPVRATCDITLEEYPSPSWKQNPTSGGQVGYRSHVLIEGETLHSLAWSEYSRADMWRGIAEANGIDDPLRVKPGTRLLLPPAGDVARMS
jgi:nucleoid-associated protein YgaU